MKKVETFIVKKTETEYKKEKIKSKKKSIILKIPGKFKERKGKDQKERK